MQPGKTQLFESLKVYLKKNNRLQPIIGLNSILECVMVGKQNREPWYLCKVCTCQLSKADIRNHILGSQHRFNYIKASHPHLMSGWQKKHDLSEMAWPLMELAKRVEREEGPGDAQLLEVEDAAFRKMAVQTENDDAQTEAEGYSDYTSLHCPDQSQRIISLQQNQQRFLQEDMKSRRISAYSRTSPTLKHAHVKSDIWLENVSISQFENPQTLGEPLVVSENSFLDDYTGTKPLIGLHRVVECRSEEGDSNCFLCHCCRIRSNKKDIIDHLISSSHICNYLMEGHPKQVEAMTADIPNNLHFLQSLATKVEQEEGRGELKVLNVPESFCRLLTVKSYHWCVQMLQREWTNFQKQKMTHKGPRLTETSGRGKPQKHAPKLPESAKRGAKKRKMKKVTDTVFTVSLPLTRGPVMVERTCFDVDNVPVVSEPPSSDWDLIPSTEMVHRDLDYHPGSFTDNPDDDSLSPETSQLQQDLYSEWEDADQHIPRKNLTVTLLDLDGYINDYLYCNQHGHETEDYEEHEERRYSKYHGSQETSERLYKRCHNEEKGLLPAVSHTHDWSPTYSHEECGSELLYNSTLETGNPNMSYSAIQHYDQQHLQNQYIAGEDTSLLGVQGVREEPGPVDVERRRMHHFLSSTSSVPAVPGVQSLQTEQRPMHFAPQSYWAQASAYGAQSTGHGFMWQHNYNYSWSHPCQISPAPLQSVSPTQPNAFN